jgi:hypothetical protein
MFGPGQELPALIRFDYAPNEPQVPPVAGIGEWAQGDRYALRVDSAQVAWVPNSEGNGYLSTPVLNLRFTLKNTGEEVITYRPPHRDSVGAVPVLAAGDSYLDRVRPGANQTLAGQITQSQQLLPGAEMQDLALFERPEPDVTELLLYFPGRNVDRQGQVRVRVPFTWSDPPMPPELLGTPPTPPPVPEGTGQAPPGP